MEKYTVNRQQFHFLLNQFLAKHRLQEKWFNASMSFKMQDTSRRSTYERYNIKSIDNYNEHLYKCIDIYIREAVKHAYTYYNGCIYGFFRFIPSGGCDAGDTWDNFWKKYSDLWEEKTYDIKYSKDGEDDS